jgi:hypothetical protein
MLRVALLAPLALGACGDKSGGTPEKREGEQALRDAPPPPLQAKVIHLENLVRELAHTNGCGRVEDCQTVPIGVGACPNGAREYVVYCGLSTDRELLRTTAEELHAAEKQAGKDWHRGAPCLSGPPKVEFISGACQGRGW